MNRSLNEFYDFFLLDVIELVRCKNLEACDTRLFFIEFNNGVYDNSGNRIGYEVRAPSGVTNIYSNDGRRMGYVPAPQR